jgi:hypothetical protein
MQPDDQGRESPHAEPRPLGSRRDRFLASNAWLILKNVLGWVFILASFVAGPLVPGPGGLPLFLIGFALISFPGKRRLTARILRGKPVKVPPGPFALISLGTALVLAALVVAVLRGRSNALADHINRSAFAMIGAYLMAVTVIWLIVRVSPHALNLLLRISAKVRRRIRPGLRRHHIHLLPPRWRRRHAHEPGSGPLRIKPEILKFYKRQRP